MMRGKLLTIMGVTLGLAIVCVFTVTVIAAEVPRMTKKDLKARLTSRDVVILDVRIGKDWKDSELKIKGAVRENPKDVDSWADKYPKDKTIVLYCA
jgi:hypothetical protein